MERLLDKGAGIIRENSRNASWKLINHQPVMVGKVLFFLNVRPGCVYIDATCGTGHHARAILEKAKCECRVLCVDKDHRAIERAKEYLREFLDRVIFVRDGFENIQEIIKRLNIDKISGILFDLGFSSEQISDPGMGLGFRQDALLDMRFDQSSPVSAYDVVNKWPEKNLEEIFRLYGEMRDAKRIARLICKERKIKPFETTRHLADFIARYRRTRKSIHPATQVFQAIRICVNNELENLKAGLEGSLKLLAPGARIVVISYHSLEDRIVKNFMRTKEQLKVLTKKPVVPDEMEKSI
ncbi:MAG TPA: 16S rRNA (cytosine(1402)-N(4))-methyltransferase RsmH, partial [bacterium]|nr:16S rRNA (cytosine(1402)-N(4))-methyltransferase RsmH [bacterium]